MCIYSKFWLEWEKNNLAPYSIHSDHVWYSKRLHDDGAKQAIDRCGNRSRYRTAFEIDKDRITNSQAFRRLEYKTQVFVTHEGDNFRTRLTHTLEVSEIARHIARSLRFNENLTEAIALGHDLGHAPYGHAAEEIINKWLKEQCINNFYFCHNRNSIEIIDHLEPGYDWDNRPLKKGFALGLNLTYAVREGILCHSSMGYLGRCHFDGDFDGKYDEAIRSLAKANREKQMFFPGSLEAQIVRISDVLAHRIHDLEDGLRSRMISKKDIIKVILEFIHTQENKIFDLAKISTGPTIIHKQKIMEISKIFLDHILESYAKINVDNNIPDPIFEYVYAKAPSTEKINEINNKLEHDEEYRRLFLLAAIIAFMLYMWRDDQYLSTVSREDLSASRTRVLKYFNLLMKMYDGLGKGNEDIPAYNLIAFLRGITLANVIEHSFWKIHRLLDPDFKHIAGDSIKIPRFNKKAAPFCLVFIIADGICIEKGRKLEFKEPKAEERRYCFEFQTETDVNDFMNNHFQEILESNGEKLDSLREKHEKFYFARKIKWLNRNEDPRKTEFVTIVGNDNRERVLPLRNVRVYFTGYKEICPGLQKDKQCLHSTPSNTQCLKDKNEQKCQFYVNGSKYPDVNRLIEIQDDLRILDKSLEDLISERIHCASRVARMNYMGKKIIYELLNEYLSNPRLMHDRVWSRLRCYQDNPNLSAPVDEWIKKTILEREKLVVPENVINHLTDESQESNELKWKANRFSLIRRIIEYISGMTDRFLSNEYNRINQSGREVELQDETYFFF
jgi:predicted deoxyguanosinetriphosphate triphosphohydrolase